MFPAKLSLHTQNPLHSYAMLKMMGSECHLEMQTHHLPLLILFHVFVPCLLDQ